MSAFSIPSPPLRRDATVIGLVGMAHGISHFSQLLLAPLLPWLKDAFDVTYAQLGFLLTIFFIVSCVSQTVSGFWVDRFGPRPVLMAGLGLVGLAALGFASSTSYTMLAAFSVLAGTGNGVFHPVDYTLLNRGVSKARLGHAYSVHGITGNLGWALAPVMLVPITLASSWRVALLCAAGLAFTVLAVLWLRRADLDQAGRPVAVAAPVVAAQAAISAAGTAHEHTLAFLKIPAVWMCFGFFLFYAGALSIVQSFATQSAAQLHAVPANLAAMCLTVYMVCSAGGTLIGGFLAADMERCERVVGIAFGLAAVLALCIGFTSLPAAAVPVLFGAMGLASGIAGPSRDVLVKRSTPDNASGRVYGVVYAGLDIGQAVVPLGVGLLMDRGAFRSVWAVMALLLGVLVVGAFRVRRVRRVQRLDEAAATA
jgi:MFS transporter, FSR family, fosmidomycin resistance protein